MTTHAEATIAARVREDLRRDAELVARNQGVDLSTVIRKALARYVDAELGRSSESLPPRARTAVADRSLAPAPPEVLEIPVLIGR